MAAGPRRLVPLIAALIAAGVLLSACSGDDSGDIGDIQAVRANCGDVTYSGSEKAEKLIVSDLPLQGDSAERSEQMNAAMVQEIARKGWQAGARTQVAFQECDDSLGSTGEWDEATCRRNAQAYASNPDVIGVIGTYNSGCAAIEIPILNRAPGGGVPMVSPGNTFVCLTEPSPTLCAPDEPGSYYPTGTRNYVRVVPNDAVQGAGLASFADEIGVKEPFILVAAHDPTSKGQGTTFENAAKALGMRIAGVIHWDPDQGSYANVMRAVESSGADGIVLAGLLEQNGAQLIRDKVAVLGPNDGAVKLLAFDGFAQQSTIERAGGASAGMFASLPGKAPGTLTGAGDAFVKEVRAQIGDEPLEVFAPYAGQAAEVLLDAIRRGRTRAGTVAELFETDVRDGITGSFVITPTGDPEPAPISVQRAGTNFVLARTITPPAPLVSAARGG